VIRKAIHEAYARAKKEGHNAPNLNQIAAPTKLILAEWGYCAQSDNQIKDLAGEAEFKALRRKVGVRLSDPAALGARLSNPGRLRGSPHRNMRSSAQP
jgi:hypothetical protein